MMKKQFILSILLALSFCAYSQTAIDYFNSGFKKGKSEDFTGAIVDYTKAIELNPKYGEAYYFRGVSKYFLDDYTGAIGKHPTNTLMF